MHAYIAATYSCSIIHIIILTYPHNYALHVVEFKIRVHDGVGLEGIRIPACSGGNDMAAKLW